MIPFCSLDLRNFLRMFYTITQVEIEVTRRSQNTLALSLKRLFGILVLILNIISLSMTPVHSCTWLC